MQKNACVIYYIWNCEFPNYIAPRYLIHIPPLLIYEHFSTPLHLSPYSRLVF